MGALAAPTADSVPGAGTGADTPAARVAALAADLREKVAQAAQGGPEHARRRHRERGKLPVRERVGLLLDPGSPFLELSQLAAHGVYDDPLPGAGIVTGVGDIAGRPCMVVANDATVKGGAYYPLTVKKHLRAQEIAMRNRLPCVYLVDSGGAYLKGQAEVFPDRDHFGRIFRNQALMGAAGIAQVAVVMGSCTAGGAYIPAMADETVIVDGQGEIYLAGPPLVKVATGEVSDSADLGGGAMHARESGLVDHLAADDRAALAKARGIVANLGPPPGLAPPGPLPSGKGDGIYGAIDPDLRRPSDARALLACVLDDGALDEFKPGYGPTLVTGFGRVGGRLVGTLANNGVLFSESAQKGAHFIQLCDGRGIPLVFFQNITGFMVGARYESGGIAKHGAMMVRAVSCARVPKVTVVVGNSYGAGNYAMCGRAYDPDFIFMWPTARIAVMGGEQAAGVLAEIRAQREPAPTDEELGRIRRPVLDQFEEESDPYHATARLWDDGVIDPAQTAQVLALALRATDGRERGPGGFGTFRM